MSGIRFITSSDEHLSDLAPGFRKDDYRSAVLRKLEWQGELARKFGADAVLRGGDLFHVKAANKTTMATLALTAGIHRRYPCPTFSTAGNHDMSQNDPLTVPRQPLGVLFEAGAIRPLRDESFTSGSMRVRVIGVEYTTDLDDEGLRDLIRKRDGDTYTIAVVHALAAHAPEQRVQSFFHERIFDYRDLVFEGCPDAYVFGHYHKDQGIQEHLGVQFVNLGAVSRGALTFENLERVPKVSSIVCDSRGISIEEHEIPCGDPAAIFDLERKAQLERERRDLNEFIAMIRASADTPEDGGIRDRVEALRTSDLAEDVKNVVLATIEAAEAGVLEE